jgi:hypothetical protein
VASERPPASDRIQRTSLPPLRLRAIEHGASRVGSSHAVSHGREVAGEAAGAATHIQNGLVRSACEFHVEALVFRRRIEGVIDRRQA